MIAATMSAGRDPGAPASAVEFFDLTTDSPAEGPVTARGHHAHTISLPCRPEFAARLALPMFCGV